MVYTVGELIKELLTNDLDMKVFIASDEEGNSMHALDSVSTIGYIEDYPEEIYSVENEDAEPVVLLWP